MAKKKKKTKTASKKKKVAPKRGKKRLAKPRKIPEPPPPGTPEILLEPEPAKGGRPPESTYIPPAPDAQGTHYPRFAAGMYYTTDLKGATIEQLHRHPMWNRFSIYTLHQWSREDQWVERRRANMERWQRAIEARIGTEVVKARMADLGEVREIYQKMIKKLKGKALKARSYEGMVSALVKLAELMDGWSERLSKEFVPEAPMGGELGIGHGHEVKPSISAEEARVAAKAIMQDRRQQLRLKQASEEALSEGEDRPVLTVIGGGEGG
jgi:hypothetical protein